MQKGEKGKGISYRERKNIDNNYYLNINIQLNYKYIICDYIKMVCDLICEVG